MFAYEQKDLGVYNRQMLSFQSCLNVSEFVTIKSILVEHYMDHTCLALLALVCE